MTETPRVAIVTGAAGGIGRAMVRGLLAAGIRVAGVDRDRETTPRRMQSPMPRAASLAASTSWSTTPASAREQSGRTAGSAPSNSGRSHLINGAALSRFTQPHRWR
jgi:NAD(P)-dependent dehydrogenase (short-subunit alcohol dehydrogenase family)